MIYKITWHNKIYIKLEHKKYQAIVNSDNGLNLLHESGILEDVNTLEKIKNANTIALSPIYQGTPGEYIEKRLYDWTSMYDGLMNLV